MYYTLVSKEKIPNTKSMYNGLSKHTARARELGVLPINCFRDRYSIINIDDKYLSPQQIIDNYLDKLHKLPEDYKGLPRWCKQLHYVEIWTEKDAMLDEFYSISKKEGLEVRIVSHGGYVSLTQLNDSVKRLEKLIVEEEKKHIHILYFGDFDPSGVQMLEDIKNRLAIVWSITNGEMKFTLKDEMYEYSFDLQRVAVNEDQVIEYDLPKDPQSDEEMKKLENDRRTNGFIREYGEVYATEVDTLPALKADVFENMVVNGVNQYFDQDIYNHELEVHKEEHSPNAITKLVKQKTKRFLIGQETEL
jgi:hypothetical protein